MAGSKPDPRANYRASFSGSSASNSPTDSSRMAAALAFAIDVRKFEIELYWKRAAYFWAFSAAAFGAYVAALSSKDIDDKPEVLLLVSCLGLVFATAWYLVNRASKYWQHNWELHVDLLEDDYMGPIYKTVLEGHSPIWRVEGAYPFSVSKINQLLSLFVATVFALLLTDTLWQHFKLAWPGELFPTGCLLATVAFLVLFGWKGRVGDKRSMLATATIRNTELIQYSLREAADTRAKKPAGP